MSDFWWGVLTLPLILVGLALAAVIVLGGWLITEQWCEKRAARNLPQEVDEPIRPERSGVAAAVLVSPRLRTIRLGWGCGLTYYRGLNRVREQRYRRLVAAIGDVRREDERES